MSEARMMIDPPPADWRPYAVDQLHRAERAEAGLAATKDALRHALLTCIDMRTRCEIAEAKVAKVEARVGAGLEKLGRLIECIEDECIGDADSPICREHDRTDEGECALVADLEVIRAVLADAPAEQRAEGGA